MAEFVCIVRLRFPLATFIYQISHLSKSLVHAFTVPVLALLWSSSAGNVTHAFYDQLSDLLESLATFSAPLIIVGDFSLHTDNQANTDYNKFAGVLSYHDLQPLVTSPTHRLGHTLELFIMHSQLVVNMHPVDLPLLTDIYRRRC